MLNLWNWLDWLLAVIVLLSTMSGISEGFTRGIVGLASLVVGLVVAAVGYISLGNRLRGVIHTASLAYGTAFLVLFIGVLIVGALVAALVKKLIRTAGMNWLDRLLGLFFGIVRGGLVDAVVIMIMLSFSIKAQAVRDSKLAPSIVRGSEAAVAVMPADIQARFKAGLGDLRRTLLKVKSRA